ncbi:MAG: hypothetical protein F8N39_16030 [Clostridiaceae bacterium]|nr:hypothetical protein [Clostridiaceae bacterium]
MKNNNLDNMKRLLKKSINKIIPIMIIIFIMQIGLAFGTICDLVKADPVKSTQEITVTNYYTGKLMTGAGGTTSGIKINVTDSSNQDIPQYINNGGETKNIIFDNPVRLAANPTAKISYGFNDVTFSKYNFVKTRDITTKPQFPADTEMIDIHLPAPNTREAYKNDLGDQGYITTKHYVYKGKAGEELPRDVSFGTPVGDGVLVQQAKSNNDIYETQGPNSTAFLNPITAYSGNTPITNAAVKAMKLWGYFCPKNTGSYMLGAYSDDGAYGYIMVDGVKKVFVEDWRIAPPQDRSNCSSMQLTAGKYYPIYMEWYEGCPTQAAFIPRYNCNGKGWVNIPQDEFYSSKTTTPGDVASAYFGDVSGISFPTKDGIYYMATKFVSQEGTTQGIYGPFIVDNTKPVLSNLVVTSNNANSNKWAVAGNTLTIKFTASENLSANPQILINGYVANSTITKDSQNNYTATVIIGSDGSINSNGDKLIDGTINIQVAHYSDLSGNEGDTVSNSNVTYDNTAPTTPTITTDNKTVDVTIMPGLDTGSGVKNTQYKILSVDGNTVIQDWIEYIGKFNVSKFEDIKIQAKTVDNAGNESTVTECKLLKLPEVTININDATGLVDIYKVDINNTDTKVNKFLPNEIKLKGDAYANIDFKGQGTDIFQYKIIPYSTDPKGVNIDQLSDWQTLDLNKQTVNDDVVLDKQGNLNQRSYDVSHLPTLSGNAQWSNPDEVFKTPFDATTYKVASYSTSAQNYGGWQNYLKIDGTQGRRWVTNSIFLPNMWVSDDYKEASKFWGYIKVPKSGEYYLGATSDDGCRGYITVNGETLCFVDMFYPKEATWGTKNKVYTLEADKYYPIYLEYFNWGGSAAFELKCSTDNKSWAQIPQDWFYPSKTLTPGEYTKTIFTGSTGIKFPKEPGKYYIAYRAGKKDANGNMGKVNREGFYGGFTVEAKAQFDLSRSLDGGKTSVQNGSEFKLNYTVTPKDIPVKDVCKNGEPSSTYTITASDFAYQDVFPQGLTPLNKDNNPLIVINDGKINGQLNVNNIVYTLDDTKTVYKAQPINFSVWLKASEEAKQYKLEGKDSVITYVDIDGGKKQANFPDFNLSVDGYSTIVKQGAYQKNNLVGDYIKEPTDVDSNDNSPYLNVTKLFPTTLAMIVDSKASNPNLELKISGNFINKEITFYKYELKQDGTLGTVQQLNAKPNDVKFRDLGFTFEKDKKYIIFYTINPSESGEVKIENTVDRDKKNLKLKIQDLPLLQ